MSYVFYNKKLEQIFNQLCTASLEELRTQCKDLDNQLCPYTIRKTPIVDKYIVEKDGEPLDEYGYFAKVKDEIMICTLQEALDFINDLKKNTR